jgi:hypothetical protein
MARESITVDQIPTPNSIFPWTGGDDRDYFGHAPRVNVLTWTEVRNRSQLWARIWVRASEDVPDNHTAYLIRGFEEGYTRS